YSDTRSAAESDSMQRRRVSVVKTGSAAVAMMTSLGGPRRGPRSGPRGPRLRASSAPARRASAAPSPARPRASGADTGLTDQSDVRSSATDTGRRRSRTMAQEVRGVIAPAKDEPVRIETVVVPDPGPGEAVVRIQACGVCHTDLHYKQGGISDDFPFLLGHEAAGVVESVGDGVSDVAPGDFVILNWRAVCGK